MVAIPVRKEKRGTHDLVTKTENGGKGYRIKHRG